MINKKQEKNFENPNNNYKTKENHLEMFRQIVYESQFKTSLYVKGNLHQHDLKNNSFKVSSDFYRILL